MEYATNFAIVEDGVVTNIAWGMVYEARDNIVQIDELAVQIGDTYEDGVFYHDGERVLSNADFMAEMNEALNILLGGEQHDEN